MKRPAQLRARRSLRVKFTPAPSRRSCSRDSGMLANSRPCFEALLGVGEMFGISRQKCSVDWKNRVERGNGRLMTRFFFFPKTISSTTVPPIAELELGRNLNPDAIVEGNDVYFDCRVRSNPAPSRIVWTHEVRLFLSRGPSSLDENARNFSSSCSGLFPHSAGRDQRDAPERERRRHFLRR